MAPYTDPNEEMVSQGVSRAPIPAPETARQGRYISADEFIRRASKVVTEAVYIPLVDGEIIVRSLTGVEVTQARSAITMQKNGRTVPRTDRDFGAMVLYYAAQTPDGQQFFQRHHIEALNSTVNNAAIQPGVQVALRLSGLDDEAAEIERKKHFETTRDAE